MSKQRVQSNNFLDNANSRVKASLRDLQIGFMQSRRILNQFKDKKFLFAAVVLLAVAVLIGKGGNVTTTGLASGDYKLGDANLDGVIDDTDLELFLDLKKSCVEGLCTPPQGMKSQCSNVDKDSVGKLTETDYDEFLTKIFVGEQDLGRC